jgi:glycosyltransferase involved in cell wall biosynthesis
LRQRNDIYFTLAGDGPEKEELLRLIREYGLEKSFGLAGFVEDMATFTGIGPVHQYLAP